MKGLGVSGPIEERPPASVWAGTLERWEIAASRFVEKRRWWLLALWSFIYLSATCYRASRKAFWFDEIATSYLTNLPSLAAIWQALAHAADLNPPLFYCLTRISEDVLGHGKLGTRMPEIVGFWIFCLCLYRFVSVKTTALAGFVAMSFPLFTRAYYYAYEARPHGIVLGFGGVAFLCWQAATERASTRRWSVPILGLSLACALLTHGYAFLLFVPIVLAEIVRFWRTRRMDIFLWSTIAVSSTAILATVWLLTILRDFVGTRFLAVPNLGSLVNAYGFFYAPAATVLCLAVALIGLTPLLGLRAVERDRAAFGRAESALIVGSLLIPVASFAVASLLRTPMVDRYNLSTVFGASCLLGIAMRKSNLLGVCFLVLLFGQGSMDFLLFRSGTSIMEPSSNRPVSTSEADLEDQLRFIAAGSERELPIVLTDALEFAPLVQQASPAMRARMYFLGLDDEPRRNTDDVVNWDMDYFLNRDYKTVRACCGIPEQVITLSSLRGMTHEFLVYAAPGDRGPDGNWKLEMMRKRGVTMSILGARKANWLLSAKFGE